MDQQVATEVKSTMQQVAEARNAAREKAMSRKEEQEEQLPEGAAPIEARKEEVPAEAAPAGRKDSVEGEAAAPVEEEESIRIGERVFKTQSEAIKYAEELERGNLVAEAYNQGIRETLAATQKPDAPPPEEENFEERFYSNPKEVLKEVQAKARDEALAMVKAEQRKESLWSEFFTKHPDLAGSRRICEQVLQENWDILGNMVDIPKAMGILATKTRSIFQDYIDRTKPRTEMSAKGGQAVSPSGGAPSSVTQAKKVDPPLDFISEMKKLRRQG